MPATAAAIISGVAIRQPLQERIEGRLESRRIIVILDADLAARDACRD